MAAADPRGGASTGETEVPIATTAGSTLTDPALTKAAARCRSVTRDLKPMPCGTGMKTSCSRTRVKVPGAH